MPDRAGSRGAARGRPGGPAGGTGRRRNQQVVEARRAPGPGLAGALILALNGLVLTAAGLLVQSGLIRPGAGADHRALACLHDPWFLLWGLFATAALLRAGRARGGFPAADPAR